MVITKSCAESKSRLSLISFFLLVLLPVLAVPFMIYGMTQNKKWAFIQWAFFMGLLGILYPPTGDLYRYTMTGSEIGAMSFNSFCQEIISHNDYFLWIISYIITHLGLHIDLTRFIFNFLAYFFLGKMCYEILRNNPNIKHKEYILVVGILISFSINLFLLRFWLAGVILVYGSYLIVLRNRKSGWLFILWSVSIHFSMVAFVVMLILQQLGLFRFNRIVMIIMSLLALFLDSSSAIFTLSLLPDAYFNAYISYLDGYWAGNFLENYSLKFRIWKLLENSTTYIAVAIFYITYNNDKLHKKRESLINAFTIITAFFAISATIYGRFLSILIIAVKVFSLSEYCNTQKFRRCLIALFLTVMFSNAIGLWAYRRELSISAIPQIAYTPSPILLSHSFDRRWININIMPDGDFKY